MSRIYLAVIGFCALLGVVAFLSPETVFQTASHYVPEGALFVGKVIVYMAGCIVAAGFVVSFFKDRNQSGKELAGYGLILAAFGACFAFSSIAVRGFSHWHQGLAGIIGVILFFVSFIAIVMALPEKPKTEVPAKG